MCLFLWMLLPRLALSNLLAVCTTETMSGISPGDPFQSHSNTFRCAPFCHTYLLDPSLNGWPSPCLLLHSSISGDNWEGGKLGLHHKAYLEDMLDSPAKSNTNQHTHSWEIWDYLVPYLWVRNIILKVCFILCLSQSQAIYVFILPGGMSDGKLGTTSLGSSAVTRNPWGEGRSKVPLYHDICCLDSLISIVVWMVLESFCPVA